MADVRAKYQPGALSNSEWKSHLDKHLTVINARLDHDGQLWFDSEQDYFLFALKYS